MSRGKTKVAIIGAGFVGSSIAFAMALSQIANEIVLIDVVREKAYGEAMDISHGLCFVGQMAVYSGDYSDVRDCDVIIITAGLNRKPGETRIDLARKNMIIAKDITASIMKHYNGGVILVVANPVDVQTYMIQKWSGLAAGRVFGSGTVLDSARFRFALGEKIGVDLKNIHGYIIGEHGETQFPAWSATHVAGIQIDEYMRITGKQFTEEEKTAIAEDVKKSGAMIIKNKGATYYAISIAVNTLVETLIKNQNTIRTVSSVMTGTYGLHDVALSVPSIVNGQGVQQVIEFPLSDDEITAMQYSAEQLRLIIKEVENI
jgi:L-lactate dehydrogenase